MNNKLSFPSFILGKLLVFFVALFLFFSFSYHAFAATLFSNLHVETSYDTNSEPFLSNHMFHPQNPANTNYLGGIPAYFQLYLVSGTCENLAPMLYSYASAGWIGTLNSLVQTGNVCQWNISGGANIIFDFFNPNGTNAVLGGSNSNTGNYGNLGDPTTSSLYANGGVAFQICDIGGCSSSFISSSNHNPVLIIPGVLGTDIKKGAEKLWLDLIHNLSDIGDQFMDPLQFNEDLTPSDPDLTTGDVIKKASSYDYSNGLIKEFENQGYVENADLFLFPYDWRYGVSTDIVNQLQQKIQNIRMQTGSDKVDVVAHSTGGLLVKKYVIDHSSDNHIGKAVFVGVPNTGAPKAIKALVQGDNFGNYFVADSEMKKISKNLPVAYDLSPSQQYFNTKGSYITIVNLKDLQYIPPKDLNFEESSNFLIDEHNLNARALTNAHVLHTADFDNYDLRNAGVDLYNIAGCKSGTIGKIIEVRHHDVLGNVFYTDYATPEKVPGDSTVPLESSTNLPITQTKKYFGLKTNHGKMLSQEGIRQTIVNIISNNTLPVDNRLVTQDITECKLNGKAISVDNLLDVDVTDQNGNHSGLVSGGVQNDIPNAGFEVMGDKKFIYLPDDEGQVYTVKVKGRDTGLFTVKEQKIVNNQVTHTQLFPNIPVTTSLVGQINLADIPTLALDNNGDGTTDQTILPSSTVDIDKSQDFIPPVSTLNVVGTIGQTSFYRSNVTLNIIASDPVVPGEEIQTSGVLKTVYRLDDDPAYTAYINPFVISSEGKHTLKFFSTDKASFSSL